MYRMFCISFRNYVQLNHYKISSYDTAEVGNAPYAHVMENERTNITLPQDCPGDQESATDFREKIAWPIGVLADVALYREIRESNVKRYQEVGNLVYAIQQAQERYPAFRAFSWELYGFGFDAEAHDGYDEEVIEEQLKLIDLLLSCHYWYVA